MYKFKKAAVIGCGGIAVNLVPGLSRLMNVVLVDGDKYEPKNVTRQFPALHSTENKAKVLAEMINQNTTYSVETIERFAKDSMIAEDPAWQGVDIIIGCVDNNTSRKLIVEIADDYGIPCILAGNEHEAGEAHCFIPMEHNPLDHFDFEEGEPVPWGCNDDLQIEENPQTPLANIMAASATFQIILSLQKVKNPKNAIVHSVLEPLFSSSKRAKDFEKAKERPKLESAQT